MWFKNEEHYKFYLQRTKKAHDAMQQLQEALFKPLIERMKRILKREK